MFKLFAFTNSAKGSLRSEALNLDCLCVCLMFVTKNREFCHCCQARVTFLETRGAAASPNSRDFWKTRKKCSKTEFLLFLAHFRAPVFGPLCGQLFEYFSQNLQIFGASRHLLAGCCLVKCNIIVGSEYHSLKQSRFGIYNINIG